MSSAQPSPLAPEEIARDATWLAQALDPNTGMARLVAMNRDSYRAASFLDDRLMQQQVDAQIVPWPDVQAAIASNFRADARWIFHIGHVGSTLVSRLLGELDGVLGVREPRLLRDLALSPADVRRPYIRSVPKLMSRTFGKGEVACVKATSFASEIATELVPSGERALFMYARPGNYVASILAGENSAKELHMLAEQRGRRLAARGIHFPVARNDAERAAAAWACEMTALEAAAIAMTGRRIEWADFDSMLDNMEADLSRAATFFSFSADQRRLRDIAGGPLMQRYSKALEYEYSPRLRAELIAEASRRHEDDIAGALAMLAAAAEKSELLASALRRATPER